MKFIKTELSKSLTILSLAILVSISGTKDANAQVEVSTGMDLYSTYVWRGVAYSGPSWQPYVDLAVGDLTIGAWGSQGYDGFQEMDLYISYSLGDLSAGLTSYYYPGSNWTEEGSQAYEVNLGYSLGSISIGANYILNDDETGEGAGHVGQDMYFELGYSGSAADIFVGAGNGWHSLDTDPDEDEFAPVNGILKLSVIIISFDLVTPIFTSPKSVVLECHPSPAPMKISAALPE